MIKFGFFTDSGLDKQNIDKHPWNKVKLNSYGYRCPDWDPMPDGKKNVVVLGCSHTFGQALDDDQHWVHFLSQHNTKRLRYWNLGVPGASADACVRRLWGTQKLLAPELVIMCWPVTTRREWYDTDITALHGTDPKLAIHDNYTDLNNFLHNVFWVEKFAEVTGAKTFHCFADTPVEHDDLKGLKVLEDFTIRNCWPYWDRFQQRQRYDQPSFATDGKHYGVDHHERFAQLFLEKFSQKLR